MKTLLLWASMFGFVTLGILAEGGHLGSLVQGTSACIVLLPVLAYLLFAYGFKGFFGFWKRVLARSTTVEDTSKIDTSVSLGFLFGAISVVIGLIHVMENLSDTSKLGAGIAVAFVSVVYAVIPAALLFPVRNQGQSAKSGISKTASFTAASFMMLLFSFFVVLYATSSKV